MKTYSTPSTIREFYVAELDSYKTVSSKKAMLTRSRKQCEEHHDDVVRAYNGQRWLHGERISIADVREIASEIRVIRELYSNL